MLKDIEYYLLTNLRALRHRYIDNFVFIHINKTGGSSIERAFKLPFEHKTALEKIDEIGVNQWERRFTFSVIRNPWDKVVSHYHYRIQTNQSEMKIRPIDFNKWVKLAYFKQDRFYFDMPKMFNPQTAWISDKNGTILVDYICRFENLVDDFKCVCNKLNKNVDLPHVKASKHEDYQKYYNKESMKIIENWFEDDINQFGYKFD